MAGAAEAASAATEMPPPLTAKWSGAVSSTAFADATEELRESGARESSGGVGDRSVESLAPAILHELRFHRGVLEQLVKGIADVERDSAKNADLEPETGLDYQDSWPMVEISVEVNEVLRFDLSDLTFDADVTVRLDWLDSKLERGTHYQWNAEIGKFEFAKTLRNCTNDMHFFNPEIVIENSKMLAEAESPLPSIVDEISRDAVDIPWLTRAFRFQGTMACRHVNAKIFPFDIESLQIKISCAGMTGVTSLGQRRRIHVREASLRKNMRLKMIQKTGSLAGWVSVDQTDEAMSHQWRLSDDDDTALSVGDMVVVAVGGVRLREGFTYVLHIVLRRVWYPRYFFDFLIQNLQVMGAIASLFVPFSSDMLADRMSITLTILLTVVASTSSRPPAIAGLAHPTTYDTYMQVMIFSVALIGLGNAFVYLNCWGMFREDGKDDYFDEKLNMEVSEVRSSGIWGLDESWCEEGKCGASYIDCYLLYFTIISLIFLFLIISVRAQMHQISAILQIKHDVDAIDQEPGKYSKLVLCLSDRKFRFVDRLEVLDYIYHVGLFTGVRWFWGCWRLMRWLRMRATCCFRGRDQMQDAEPFHPVSAQRLLRELSGRSQDSGSALPSISRFHAKLSPFETFRVLDVGSGEIGFYSYWLHRETRLVCAGGTREKFKYAKHCTFSDQFLEDTEQGAISLANEVIQQFELTQRVTTGGLGDSARFTSLAQSPEQGVSIGSPPPSPATVPAQGPPELLLPGMIPLKDPSSNFRSDLGSGGEDKRNLQRTGLKAKKKLLLGMTGANRQMLREEARGRELVDDLLSKVNSRLQQFALECIPYSPEDVDEAMYELWATEWVVQNGDLDVSSMKLDKTYRTLQGGHDAAETNLEEVQREFRDLAAGPELLKCYCGNHESPPAGVVCSTFYSRFEATQPLLRALLRARLFTGTLSAGSGSVQMTLRSSAGLESSQVHSLPLGNRTPLIYAKADSLYGGNVFARQTPLTRERAEQLFGRGRDDRCQAAWPEDGPVDGKRLSQWHDLVKCCAEERKMPSNQRGLFVGISAYFYAAKLAGCAEVILERDPFLAKLYQKRDQLMMEGGTDGRGLANLTLVAALLEYTLHRSAMVVCKRSWHVGDTDVIATWTLGLYLKHSGIMT